MEGKYLTTKQLAKYIGKLPKAIRNPVVRCHSTQKTSRFLLPDKNSINPLESMEDHDKYLDIKKLSEYSSLSVRTLRDYLTDKADPIPSYCIKRKILVKKSEFDQWIKRHRTDSGKIHRIADEVLDDFSTIN